MEDREYMILRGIVPKTISKKRWLELIEEARATKWWVGYLGHNGIGYEEFQNILVQMMGDISRLEEITVAFMLK